MVIEHIHLINFKNFQDIKLEAGPGFHFITGRNGVGKTNFLDSIYFMSITKSFLQPSVKELIFNGADYCRIEAQLKANDKRHDLEVKFKAITKEWIWDGKQYNALNEHIGRIPVVMIAPDEVYTLMHMPEARRKYLNQVLIQVNGAYLKHLMDHNRFLKQRNAALRQMKSVGRLQNDVLEALEAGIVQHGNIIYKQRKILVEQLNPLVKEYIEVISKEQQSGQLEYYSDLDDAYQEKLKIGREKDYFSGRTQLGIHRDKLICKLGQVNIGEQGSQGQLKTFVIALKLAQFKFLKNQKNELPIVLLDDVFAKLDEERVKLLIQVLAKEEIEQCFISDTDQNRVEGLLDYILGRAIVYQIKDGNIFKIS